MGQDWRVTIILRQEPTILQKGGLIFLDQEPMMQPPRLVIVF